MVKEKIDKDGMKNSSRAARLFVPKRFTQKTENLLVSKVFLI
mgnify:CR=1 FL=1